MAETYEQAVKNRIQAVIRRRVREFFDAELLKLYCGDQSGGQPDGLLYPFVDTTVVNHCRSEQRLSLDVFTT